MEKFAKIFEVDGVQVLFYLEPEGEEMLVHQIVWTDGFMADVKLVFKDDERGTSEELALKRFDQCNAQTAAEVMELVRGLVE